MKKKNILIILIIILTILNTYIIFNFIFLKYKNKFFIEKYDVNFANNLKNIPFNINKIVLYSSGYGENKNNNFQTSNWILDIYQYTDIALYIEASEPIKNLYISNFKSTSGKLYYLDITKFGTEFISSQYEVNPSLEYTVLNDNNKENLINYNTPIFFADSSNPITLKFVNIIAKNFELPNNQKLKFDGSILEKTNIKLENLKQKISFDITIKDYNNKSYSSNINISIPIENKNSTIFDGYVLEEKNNQEYFY